MMVGSLGWNLYSFYPLKGITNLDAKFKLFGGGLYSPKQLIYSF